MLSCCSCGNLVSHDEVGNVYQVDHILNGYRSSKLSLWQCLRSVLVLHNDVGNFWTHFIPLVLWVGWLFVVSRTIEFSDPFWHPLLVLWISACSYALFSCLAHVFQCISHEASRMLFMMDYNAIVMYGLAECYAFAQYESPSAGSKVTLTRSLLYALLCLGSSMLCCSSSFWEYGWSKMCNTVCSITIHLVAISPLLSRLWMCASEGDQCIPETLNAHFLNLTVALFCAFFFVSKFPERCAPGYFDICLHSHQLFHISCAVHTSVQLYLLQIDANQRKEVIEVSDDDGIITGLCNSLPCYVLAMLGGLLFIVALYLIKGRPTSISPSSTSTTTATNVKQD